MLESILYQPVKLDAIINMTTAGTMDHMADCVSHHPATRAKVTTVVRTAGMEIAWLADVVGPG